MQYQIATNIQKHSIKLILFICAILLFLFCSPIPVFAETAEQNPFGTVKNQVDDVTCDPATDTACKDPAIDCTGDKCSVFVKYINPIIKFLSAAAGVAVTIGLVYGGILYSSAGSDPGAVSKARNIIKGSIVALIAFLFLLAFMNWLVPGGLT